MFSKFVAYCGKTAGEQRATLWDPWADHGMNHDAYELDLYTELLHDLYCHEEACAWSEEELDPLVETLPHHLRWRAFAESLLYAGIGPVDALRYQTEIYELAGWPVE